MSYPSRRSCWRSSLRLIGCCDIEDHAVLDLDWRLPGEEAPFGLAPMPLVVGHCEDPVGAAGRVVEGQPDDLLEGELRLLDGFGSCVHDDCDGLVAHGRFLKIVLFSMPVVSGRVRVVPVAVTVADLPVAAVRDYFTLLALGQRNRG